MGLRREGRIVGRGRKGEMHLARAAAKHLGVGQVGAEDIRKRLLVVAGRERQGV
jgi:hypothetical protein